MVGCGIACNVFVPDVYQNMGDVTLQSPIATNFEVLRDNTCRPLFSMSSFFGLLNGIVFGLA